MVLLGPNGSGKTTTLKLISTTLLPDAGRVLIAGYDTRTQAREVRRRVGFAVATERSFFPRLTARENLDFFAALDDVPRRQRPARISEVLEAIGLQDAASKMVMEFSSGMYQRLGVARALMKRPPVLLLDEPTRSLDPGSADKFWDLLRQLASRGTSIILTTHNFQEAAAAGDWVAVLHRGKMSPQRRIAEGAAGVRRLYFENTGDGNGKINADEMELPVAGGAVKCGD